ncbi:MAG TPA: heavy-metal-associated domain-containing protein [Methylophilaceae bacterium]|nr:heavy-metal-associated domain-containing protein [Methylophilaceae bacterium]
MTTETIKVSGMTCGGCASNVMRSLKAIDGVNDAQVSLERKEATVDFDASRTSSEQLKSAIQRAGYEVVN